jgi:hypothetical protein
MEYDPVEKKQPDVRKVKGFSIILLPGLFR